MKRLTTMILAMAMFISSLGICEISVSAAGDDDFKVENGVITEYTGSDENVVIPREINGETVTEIGNSAFEENEVIKAVSIPDTVTVIADRAFSYCSELEQVTMPDTLIEIGAFAFSYCDMLEEVKLPERLETIRRRAFTGSGLKKITIPASIKIIEENTFYRCNELSEMTVLSSDIDLLNTIYRVSMDFSIRGYRNSVAMKYAHREEFPFYDIETDELIDAPVIDDPDFDVYNGILMEYKGDESWLVIPSSVNGETITKIGDDALYGMNLEGLTIPETVKEIGYISLAYNNFKSLNIPDSVASIGDLVFTGCRQLETLNIGKGLEFAGEDAFGGMNALKKINVSQDNNNFMTENGILMSKDKSVLYKCPQSFGKNEYIVNASEIRGYAFEYCTDLENIVLSDNVAKIGNQAFAACAGIKKLEMGKNVIDIGEGIARGAAKLVSINVDSGNEYYCDIDGVLYTKDKRSLLQYPADKPESYYCIDGIDYIGAYAMSYTSNLIKADVSAEIIGDRAFYETGAALIVVGDGTDEIGDKAFNSSFLEKIYITDDISDIGDNCFVNETKVYCFERSHAYYAAYNCGCETEIITELPVPTSINVTDPFEVSIDNGKLTIVNKDGITRRVVLYIAEYDDTHVLRNIEKKDVWISEKNYEQDIPFAQNTKIFLWNTAMKPLYFP